MARNDGIDRTVVRNQDLPTPDDVEKIQEHKCTRIRVPVKGKNATKDTIALRGWVKDYEEDIEIRYGDVEKDTTTIKTK